MDKNLKWRPKCENRWYACYDKGKRVQCYKKAIKLFTKIHGKRFVSYLLFKKGNKLIDPVIGG